MRIILLLITLNCLQKPVAAQNFTAEIMPGNRYFFYQHLLSCKWKENGKSGIVHITNISNWYQHNPAKGGMNNEVMNQVYASHRLTPAFTIMAGLFYSNATDIKPALALQFAKRFNDYFVVVVPRVDLANKGSFELMGMLEYEPQLSPNVKLYSRLQFMSNAGPFSHNRSYQRVRLGVHVKKIQTGVAVNIDEYGHAAKTKINTGIFLRKPF
jgi:hypothetical protein